MKMPTRSIKRFAMQKGLAVCVSFSMMMPLNSYALQSLIEIALTRLAEYYKSKSASSEERTFPELEGLLEADLDTGFTEANRIAGAAKDRGALRALTWGEKVSRMLLSHMDAYGEKGDALLKDTRIFVCEICGFVYIGDEAPEICPVCKVPRFKIHPVERRESYASS